MGVKCTEGQIRGTIVAVRFKKAEAERLKEVADSRDLSVSDFIRDLVGKSRVKK